MRPITVPETERDLFAPPGMENEIDSLPIHHQMVNGYSTVTSVWMLSEEDLQKIQSGANIRLGVMSGIHPPVMLWVE